MGSVLKVYTHACRCRDVGSHALFRMSMIENLKYIKEDGIGLFLKKQEEVIQVGG